MLIEIGKGLQMDVNTEALREHKTVWDHVVYIGLRNILMDAHASVKKEDHTGDDAVAAYKAASLALANKKLDAMMRGEHRTVHSGPRASAVDPVAAEALREARVFVFGRARGWEKGRDEAKAYIEAVRTALGMDADAEPKTVLAAAIAKRAAKPESIAAAKDVVAARAKITVDVNDLGI